MNGFKGLSILVVGGAGFVGSNLVRALMSLGVAHIQIVDNLLSAERANVPSDSRIRFIQGSIATDEVLVQVEDVYDYIFHLATYHGNQSSIHDPLADHEHNQWATLRLFEHVKSFRNLRKLVYSGAGCAVAEKTFDVAQATPEEAPISLQMDSPYSISKIVGEFYAVYYFNQHKLPTVRARFQNVYGPGEILGAGQWRGTPATIWRNVIPTFVYKALKGQPLPVEGGGITSRDFIYVEDIVRGLLLCARDGQPGEVFNLASGVETTISELAHHVNALTGNPAPLLFRPRRDWDHSGKRLGSTEKARHVLGFEAQVRLADGLVYTIDWTRENLSLIEDCMAKHLHRLAEQRA